MNTAESSVSVMEGVENNPTNAASLDDGVSMNARLESEKRVEVEKAVAGPEAFNNGNASPSIDLQDATMDASAVENTVMGGKAPLASTPVDIDPVPTQSSVIAFELEAAYPIAGQKRSADDADMEKRDNGSEIRSKAGGGESPCALNVRVLADSQSSVSLPVVESGTTIALSPSTPQNTPASQASARTISASSVKLSDQEVAYLRALLEQPSSRLISSEKERDELGDATYGRVVRGLDNAERAVKAIKCGSEMWMTIRESSSCSTGCAFPFAYQDFRLKDESRTADTRVPRQRRD
jgi:hypothetical protein